MKTKVTLTTFVFERRDASGKACFTWAQPPGTLRRFDVRPLPQEQARFEPLKQVRL
jgi:hypothetical protein